MEIGYLEIVSNDQESTCAILSSIHGVTFSEPIPSLGGARTAILSNGGRIGVRSPLRENEEPIVRPYITVKDIDLSIAVAKEKGAIVAVPPMELPGQGKCAIYILEGVDHGLWQNSG